MNDQLLHIRCTAEQKQAWQAAAKADDRSLASWVKSRLNAAADKEQRKA